jgi:F0F1-type ATP synthase assembly protein I
MVSNLTDTAGLTIFIDYMLNALPSLLITLAIVGVVVGVGIIISSIIKNAVGNENYSETEEPIKEKKVRRHKQTYLEYVEERREAERLLSS